MDSVKPALKDLFECKRCGFCCHGETTVSLNEEDRRRMVDFLGLNEGETAKRYWRVQQGQVQMKTVDGHCIFYKDGCLVHPARPWRCGQWPLHPAILVDPANLETIRESCPGMANNLSYDVVCSILATLEK